MTTVTKKLQIGAVALAFAASGIFGSAVAFADEDSSSDSVGNSASKTPKREKRGAKPATAPTAPSSDVAESASPTSDATADATANSIFQNQFIWFGRPNQTPPPQTEIRTFQPLADLPEYARQWYGWMEDYEFEACVLGLSSTFTGQGVVGPYGTGTTAFSSGGC